MYFTSNLYLNYFKYVKLIYNVKDNALMKAKE